MPILLCLFLRKSTKRSMILLAEKVLPKVNAAIKAK